jgi:alanyl-tRNA synthetase
MAEEAGLHVDMAGFQAAMEEAKELSRAGAKKGSTAGLKFQAEETAYLQNRWGVGGWCRVQGS